MFFFLTPSLFFFLHSLNVQPTKHAHTVYISLSIHASYSHIYISYILWQIALLNETNCRNAVKLKPTVVTAEKAYKLLEEKFAARFKTVQRAFITMDMDNDGYINLREFRAGE